MVESRSTNGPLIKRNHNKNIPQYIIVCSLPQSYLYTSDMQPPIPPCLTSEEAHCAIRELNKIYSSQDRMRETGCNTACDRTSYRYVQLPNDPFRLRDSIM